MAKQRGNMAIFYTSKEKGCVTKAVDEYNCLTILMLGDMMAKLSGATSVELLTTFRAVRHAILSR